MRSYALLFTIAVGTGVILACTTWVLYFDRQYQAAQVEQYQVLVVSQRELIELQGRLEKSHGRVSGSCCAVAERLIDYLGLEHSPLAQAIGGAQLAGKPAERGKQ